MSTPDTRRAFFQNPWNCLSVFLLAAFALCALLAPWIAPQNPATQMDLLNLRLQGPSSSFWFGTDHLSRDLLSRVLYGARISLSVGFLSAALSVSLGSFLGVIAGYSGGMLDKAIMKSVDILLSLPQIVVLLAIVGMLPGEKSWLAIALILGLTSWMSTARLVRAKTLSLREAEFVQAGKVLGYSPARLISHHILPNCMEIILVSAGLGLANAILAEAALSFLGIGLSPPIPSWGGMIAEGADYLAVAPWISVLPSMALLLVVLAANLVVDGFQQNPGTRSVTKQRRGAAG